MSKKPREVSSIEQLNDMQRYLGEETYEDYQNGLMSRRRMLKRLLLICGSSSAALALLAACGDPTATTAPTAAPTTARPTTAAATTASATTAAPTTAAPTTAAATTAAATTAAGTTAASGTTAAGTTAAGGTTAAAAAPQTPGTPRGPLVVAATDPDVQGSDVTFQSDTAVKGYLARPKAAGTYPALVVIHENRGLTDHIKDVARRLAKVGYIALAPDLASRAGGTDKVPTDQVTGYFANAKPEELVKDLNAAVSYLEQQQGLKAGKLGVLGFCFGGGYTLRLAGANPKLVAAVAYYPSPTTPNLVTTTNAAVLTQLGATDTRVNSAIPDLEKAMKDAGKTFDKKTYDGAGHAFNNDTGASYNEAAAVPAWKETLAWFDKYLNK